MHATSRGSTPCLFGELPSSAGTYVEPLSSLLNSKKETQALNAVSRSSPGITLKPSGPTRRWPARRASSARPPAGMAQRISPRSTPARTMRMTSSHSPFTPSPEELPSCTTGSVASPTGPAFSRARTSKMCPGNEGGIAACTDRGNRFRIAALRPFGLPEVSGDWDIWETPSITVLPLDK